MFNAFKVAIEDQHGPADMNQFRRAGADRVDAQQTPLLPASARCHSARAGFYSLDFVPDHLLNSTEEVVRSGPGRDVLRRASTGGMIVPDER